MNFILQLAHAGEDHESTANSVQHAILNEWYFALPLYIVVVAVIVLGTYYVTKKSKANAFLALLASLLVGGVAMYSISPPVSIFALVSGFTLTMASMFISAGGE